MTGGANYRVLTLVFHAFIVGVIVSWKVFHKTTDMQRTVVEDEDLDDNRHLRRNESPHDNDDKGELEGDIPFLENSRPVIGILTQPDLNGQEYIAASYVKYAEAAGARVIPLRYTWSEKELKTAFKAIHGILLPGGGASIDPADSKIYRAASVLYKEAEQANKLGQRFPIWGTCLGWELIATLASNYKILTDSGNFVHLGVSSSLFQVDGKSAMFANMRPFAKAAVNIGSKFFYYSHQYGVTPEVFNKSLDTRCWKITALSRDSVGKKFVASAESTCRPYYGVQFHPEKNLFEWYSKGNFPHSSTATEVSRHFISFLGKEIRKSRATAVKDSWIYENDIHNYKVTKGTDGYFYQVYIFPNSTATSITSNEGEDEPADVNNIEGNEISSIGILARS